MIETFGGFLTAKSLQKYLFLFTRQQTEKSFDFIPYRYGCFSFQANQDVCTLEKYGYIEIAEGENGRHIKLNRPGQYITMLDLFDHQALLDVKEQFGKMSQQELIGYTYRHYPYYATKSTIAESLLTKEELTIVEKQKRVYNEPVLFSIGYEGISLETYINRLILNDVHVLCDVRKNAYSQKYGFSKSQLQKACEGVGIRYEHVSDLGIESEQRQHLRSQTDYDLLFERYEQTTLIKNREALMHLRSLLDTDKRIAVTCFEKDPAQCHRTRVANALMKLPDRTYELKNI
ncbi:MAG: DUF488 family protein [Bacteroidales bacterium]